jgi:predicted GNAT family N-acyltransferase
MQVTLKKAEGFEFAICMAIRMEVFVEEQGVTPEEEQDDLDREAAHYIAFVDGKPAATGRIRLVGEKVKLERIATRAPYRGKGVGAALMRHLLDEARAYRKPIAILGAQLQAIPFYEKFGFCAVGEEYMDARIPHRWMECTLAA